MLSEIMIYMSLIALNISDIPITTLQMCNAPNLVCPRLSSSMSIQTSAWLSTRSFVFMQKTIESMDFGLT